MALSENKKMLQVSLSKEQYKWLDNFCKTHKISKSNYIKYMLCRKAEEMLMILKIDESTIYTHDELEKIIKTKWLED